MIDSFHLEKYGEMAVNYNRDLELFPVLKKIIEKITGKESMFQSPTDMGVNRVGFGIVDDDVVKEASIQEIIRRYFNTACDYKKGQVDKAALQRMKFIMEELDLKPEDRKVVNPAREYSSVLKEKCEDKNDMCPVMAIELEDGTILTGRGSDLMNASAALILNAIKYLGNIPDEMHLISRTILDPIVELKSQILSSKNNSLSCQEVLEALSICAVTNPSAAYALGKISELKGCQAHSTVMMTKDDEQTLKKIGIDVTCDPEFASQNLYYI